MKSIPGLEHGGVDMIVKNNSATVIEINTTASFGMHIFPSKGKPINVCKEIIDYYFPETKDTFVNEQLYFNYSNISKMLKNRAVNHLEVTNAINEPLYSKKYIVKGKVQGVGFRMWVRREASRYNLNGYTKNLKNGNVVVVVASSNQQLVNNFKEVLKIGSKRSKVEKVLEYDWDKRINIGFEIRK